MTASEGPQEGRNRSDDNLLWGLAFEVPVREDLSLAVDLFGETLTDDGVAQSGLFGGIWYGPWQIDFACGVIVGLTCAAFGDLRPL